MYDNTEAEFCFSLFSSDFEVADLDSGMMSFFTMLCNASQSLLNFTKRIYPLGHYGLKMLWSECWGGEYKKCHIWYSSHQFINLVHLVNNEGHLHWMHSTKLSAAEGKINLSIKVC